jgi:hypothetical protein
MLNDRIYKMFQRVSDVLVENAVVFEFSGHGQIQTLIQK